jgi:DivIVA domain-containing protein
MSMTAIDIESQKFGRSLFGYDRKHVEGFLREVADRLSEAVLERDELARQVGELRAETDRVKGQEKTLIDALASGERIIEERRQIAMHEAERILADARRQAEQVINRARQEVGRIESHLLRLRVERETFENRLTALLDEHRRLLEIRKQEAGLADQLRARTSLPQPLDTEEPILGS